MNTPGRREMEKEKEEEDKSFCRSKYFDIEFDEPFISFIFPSSSSSSSAPFNNSITELPKTCD